MSTKIEWCEETWNPVTGCTKVSEGCRNCYAERMAKRLAGRAGYPADDPFAVTLHPDRLDQPLHWKKPRRVFVCSMGDLFHEDVPHDFIMDVMLTTAEYPEHTYIIVTKRAERASKYAFDPHVWRLVKVAPTQLFSRKSGFGYSRVCVQFVAIRREDVGGNHRDTRRIEPSRNRCTGGPGTTKVGSHRHF